VERLRASQADLVHDLFVRTADENYITARWCAIHQLNTDFFWLAVHALEKYLKAVLLLNGCSAISYSHNIVRLYTQAKRIAGKLLPDQLPQPQNLVIDRWINLSPEEFLAHLFRQGNAHNRYLIYGYVVHSQDLAMLDVMIFAVRRLICPLDERVFPSRLRTAPTMTNRELLTSFPDHYDRLSMPLDEAIEDRKSPVRTVLLNLNPTAFAPPDFPHTPVRSSFSFRNPVIARRILDPLQSEDARYAAEALELAQWFLNNVQIPKEGRPGKPNARGLADQIKCAMDAAKKRANAATSAERNV